MTGSQKAGPVNSGDRRRWCGPGIHKSLATGLDPEIQPLEGSRAEEHEVARLSEDDLVTCGRATCVDHRRAGPPREHRSIGLAKLPALEPRDAERLQVCGGEPGQLCTGVHEHT